MWTLNMIIWICQFFTQGLKNAYRNVTNFFKFLYAFKILYDLLWRPKVLFWYASLWDILVWLLPRAIQALLKSSKWVSVLNAEFVAGIIMQSVGKTFAASRTCEHAKQRIIIQNVYLFLWKLSIEKLPSSFCQAMDRTSTTICFGGGGVIILILIFFIFFIFVYLSHTTNGIHSVYIHRWGELKHVLISLNATAITSR